MNILLTGGAGYIGSHTAVVLIEAGHSVFIYDNFCNSDPANISCIEQIVDKKIVFIKGDVRDGSALVKFLKACQIDAVIHFAGLKAVGESAKIPLEYYQNNVQGTISLLQAMEKCDVTSLVFSSSAAVYGDPQYLPIDENHPLSPTSAYGRSKLHVEHLLSDLANSNPKWKIVNLRYFNPVGAHFSGILGEKPMGAPNNLVPYISQIAIGKFSELALFGDDYPTNDGTGVRDYIHIMDLAMGHLSSLSYLVKNNGFETFNLGTGRGYSVLEMISAYEKVCEIKIPYQIMGKRVGDVAACYAGVEKAQKVLGWRAKKTIVDMCESSWKYTCLSKTK